MLKQHMNRPDAMDTWEKDWLVGTAEDFAVLITDDYANYVVYVDEGYRRPKRAKRKRSETK